jgi:hypothetical protein
LSASPSSKLPGFFEHFRTIMTSRTERFERKPNAAPNPGPNLEEEEEEIIRFSPEEEAVRVIN